MVFSLTLDMSADFNLAYVQKYELNGEEVQGQVWHLKGEGNTSNQKLMKEQVESLLHSFLDSCNHSL